MKSNPLLLILAFSFFIQISDSSFAQQFTLNKVSTPTGLESVGGMTQDKNGYMWFATDIGLLRYDGYEYKTYRNDPLDSNSLAQDHLETVYSDRHGIIWIATWNEGLDRMDPNSGKFTHFRHIPNDSFSIANDYIRGILEDRDGDLWIGTYGGLDLFDPKTGKFFHHKNVIKDTSSLSCDRIVALYEDRKGTIWVGTGSTWNEGGVLDLGGLNIFNKHTGKFTRYLNNPQDPHSFINNKVKSILEDSKGTFWIGSAGDGLHTMDRATGKFDRHQYDRGFPEKLSRPQVINRGTIVDFISFITEDNAGGIWIGTMGNGINHFDPKLNKIVHVNFHDSALNNRVWTAYNSNDGILWVSQASVPGLYRIDPFYANISHVTLNIPVFSFEEESENELWIGTAYGLIRQDKKTAITKIFNHQSGNSKSISGNTIIALNKDSSGTLWVGTDSGLDRYDADANAFTRYNLYNKVNGSVIGGSVNAILTSGKDSLWVGLSNGLVLINTRKNWVRYFQNNLRDANSLSANDIRALARDRSGNIWIGTFLGGLNSLYVKTGNIRHFLSGATFVSSLHIDSDGNLWAGTDAGLYKKSLSENDFTKFVDPGSNIETDPISCI
jgi:ligand-binding sensor domain-containing protein